MIVKRMLKEFAPPILVKLYKKALGKEHYCKHPFSGTYPTLSEVPRINDGYSSTEVLNQTLRETEKKLKAIQTSQFLPPAAVENIVKNLFPLMVAICLQNKNELCIFDFGGGMGTSYIDCLISVPLHKKIHFHVLDVKPTCELGKKLFAHDNNIVFHDSIPQDLKDIDIVHIGSALEYIEDYKQTLSRLITLSAKYIFIGDTFMGNRPTFATMQINLKNQGIPYWIFNYQEIITFFETQHYQLIYKSPNYQPYHDLANFPKEFGLRDSYNLLFAKSD